MENEDILKKFQDNDDLNHYNEELMNDIKLSKQNLREKSLMVSALRCKWLNYYFKEKENLQRLKKVKDKILKEKIGQKNISDTLLKMKAEDNISGNDEKIIKINKLSDNVRLNIEFLERVQNIMNDFGFNIKNAIDIIKLETM